MSRSTFPSARMARRMADRPPPTAGGRVLRLFLVFADVTVTPTAAGMPGGALIQQLLNWLSQLALWGSLASILAGAAVYGIAQNTGTYNGASCGERLHTRVG